MKLTYAASIMVFAAAGLGVSAQGSVIYSESFDAAAVPAGITVTETMGFEVPALSTGTSARTGARSLTLGGTGGNGESEAVYAWDLGGPYDFYQGGMGEVNLYTARVTTAAWVLVELLENDEVRASQQHDFTDANVWHEIAFALDGDETAINGVRFTVRRNSGASNTFVRIDDFRAVIPEPASLGIFALGAMALLARRRRAAC